jgi:hypothetical protein
MLKHILLKSLILVFCVVVGMLVYAYLKSSELSVNHWENTFALQEPLTVYYV